MRVLDCGRKLLDVDVKHTTGTRTGAQLLVATATWSRNENTAKLMNVVHAGYCSSKLWLLSELGGPELLAELKCQVAQENRGRWG